MSSQSHLIQNRKDVSVRTLTSLAVAQNVHYIIFLFKSIAIGKSSLSCTSFLNIRCTRSLFITFETGKILARETLELYTFFDKKWIVFAHLLKILVVESILDVEADVVEAARTDIASCPFKHVNAVFHLQVIVLVYSLGYLAHALIKCHDL